MSATKTKPEGKDDPQPATAEDRMLAILERMEAQLEAKDAELAALRGKQGVDTTEAAYKKMVSRRDAVVEELDRRNHDATTELENGDNSYTLCVVNENGDILVPPPVGQTRGPQKVGGRNEADAKAKFLAHHRVTGTSGLTVVCEPAAETLAAGVAA